MVPFIPVVVGNMSAIGAELLRSGALSATLVILRGNLVLFLPVIGLGVKTSGHKRKAVSARVRA